MQIIFLMGGTGLSQDEASYPLYLTELNGTLILEKQVDYCRQLGPCQFLFCLKAADSKAFQVDSVIRQLDDRAIIVSVPGKTRGAVCTALLAISHLDVSDELLLLAVNDLVDVPCGEIIHWFRSNNADAGVVAFHSVHPRYSFARVDADGSVCEFAEKNPISRNALASFYYFKKAGDFIECSKELIRKDNPVKGSFYISQTLNEMILLQKKVLVYQIPNEAFHPLKTEAQLASYLYELQEAKISK